MLMEVVTVCDVERTGGWKGRSCEMEIVQGDLGFYSKRNPLPLGSITCSYSLTLCPLLSSFSPNWANALEYIENLIASRLHN
jgi:hypothetical protein